MNVRNTTIRSNKTMKKKKGELSKRQYKNIKQTTIAKIFHVTLYFNL